MAILHGAKEEATHLDLMISTRTSEVTTSVMADTMSASRLETPSSLIARLP
jgi:hypothetical protein